MFHKSTNQMSDASKERPFSQWRKDIKAVEIYDNDVRVRYIGKAAKAVPDRGKALVTEFSYESRKKLAFVAANTAVKFLWMTTLTYPREYPSSGDVVKRQLNTYLNHCRRKGAGEYLWFLEFQRRGAPHFHILTEREYMTRDEVSSVWYNIVGSGDERHLQAGTRLERIRKPNGASRYAVKYAMKMRQKRVPTGYENVGRFWGHSRGVKPKLRYTANLTSIEQIGSLIGNEEKARDMVERCISTIYNASPLRGTDV